MTLHEAKIAQKYAKIAEQQKRYSQTVFRDKPFWIIDIKHAKLDYISIVPITKMTNQYKTQSHRKEVLIALRWQAAILGGSIVYFLLEYLDGFGIHSVTIRVLFFTGFISILVALTVLLVRRFKKYLPLSEHLILSFDLSYKILFIAVALLIFFIVISIFGNNLVSGYSKLNGYFKFISSESFNFPIRSMLTFIIIFEVSSKTLQFLLCKIISRKYSVRAKRR